MHSAVSHDGTRIVFESDRNGNSDIYIMNVDGTNERRLTDNNADDTLPGWTRDGARITFQSNRDQRRQPWPYYTMNPDGTDVQSLDNLDGIFKRWSPDGSKILSFEGHEGNTDIYIMNADGSEKKRLTTDPAYDSDMEFSPDGTKIVYESFVGDLSTAKILVMDIEGGNKTYLADGTDPEWSPDGSRIIYKARNAAGKCCDIYIMKADGSGQKQLAEMGYFHRFLPDGSRIIFFALAGDTYQIYSMNPDGSDKQPLTHP